ncbi:MAG: serine/threonine-protein kinase [Rhodocyclales bacterium]|nr:serine/threonine-protein kinase [Rhodocyclales bacterium]
MKKHLGKYELLRKLGEGATSTVYLARDPFAERDVAIKLATPGQFNHPTRGKRLSHLFLNEAALVGKLRHPHIVQIYDAIVTSEVCYIVMEYVPGETLEKHTQPGTLLPVDRVVELIFKATLALNFAQRAGITHRDIKPANLLISGDTDIKISDFGASIHSHAKDLTQVSLVGSPPYMSPEQINEEPLDHRTDIYSLGVVLFQLLTGTLPFAAEGTYQTIYQVINDPAPVASSLRRGLPPELDRIVARAMSKDKNTRYQTWEAFASDLALAARDAELSLLRSNDFADTRKFSALRAMPFFDEFSDVEIWEVLRFSDWRRVEDKAPIMRVGEPGDFFCFLVGGKLAVSRDGQALRTLLPGECFGEMAVAMRQPGARTADVYADGPADIVSIHKEALEQSSESCRMRFYRGFVDTLARRLAMNDKHVGKP